MAVASSVLGFDLVELWSSDEGGNNLHCTYIHATDDIIKLYPDIITGHYPKHKREHKLSPQVIHFNCTVYLHYFKYFW